MYIVSKDRTSCLRAEALTCIYVGEDLLTVKATTDSGKMYRLGSYPSDAAAKAALARLTRYLSREGTVFYMPSDADAKMMAEAAGPTRYRDPFGRKPRSHGGS